MRTFEIFESRNDVCRFLEQLDKRGVLPQTINITESDNRFTVFYRKRVIGENL